MLRRAQSGYIRNYAAWVVAGAILAIVYRVHGRPAMTLLDIVLFLPLAGFLMLLVVPKEAAVAALVHSLVIFVVSLGLLGRIGFSPSGYTFSTDVPWIRPRRFATTSASTA